MSNPVTEAIEAFARGEIVVVTDDDDRENEGDMIVAASLCTTEKMAFIIRNGCGIVCAPLTAGDARRLNLPPMVAANDAPLGTAFTISVDVKHGMTTGISAEQRCNTVEGAGEPQHGRERLRPPRPCLPADREGRRRPDALGHTEAAIDLCALASLSPVAVICELANDDGTVMIGPQIAAFADGTISSGSRSPISSPTGRRGRSWRAQRRFPVKTPIGELQGYAYRTPFDAVLHFAFVHGAVGDGRGVPARLHRCDIVNDVFGAGTIPKVLQRFKQEGRGNLVYLRDGSQACRETGGQPADLGRASTPDMARSGPRRPDPA